MGHVAESTSSLCGHEFQNLVAMLPLFQGQHELVEVIDS